MRAGKKQRALVVKGVSLSRRSWPAEPQRLLPLGACTPYAVDVKRMPDTYTYEDAVCLCKEIDNCLVNLIHDNKYLI